MKRSKLNFQTGDIFITNSPFYVKTRIKPFHGVDLSKTNNEFVIGIASTHKYFNEVLFDVKQFSKITYVGFLNVKCDESFKVVSNYDNYTQLHIIDKFMHVFSYMDKQFVATSSFIKSKFMKDIHTNSKVLLLNVELKNVDDELMLKISKDLQGVMKKFYLDYKIEIKELE